MDYIVYNAYAKINIALDVTGKRPDGYHNLNTIMQNIDLCDTIFIKKVNEKGIKLNCNLKWLAVDARNLVYSAASVIMDKYNINSGLYIDLTKNIPVAAGLGGGSADCAATLLALRKLFDLPITDKELLTTGKSLGADVPFCLVSKTAVAKGIGDELTLINEHPHVTVVVAKPNIRVSTADIFSQFTQNIVTKRPDIDKMVIDITNKDVESIADGFCNVLENVTENLYPEIKNLKDYFLEAGAYGALMSGSGPTVFAYFKNKYTAVSAVRKIKRKFTQPKEIYVSKTITPKDERVK